MEFGFWKDVGAVGAVDLDNSLVHSLEMIPTPSNGIDPLKASGPLGSGVSLMCWAPRTLHLFARGTSHYASIGSCNV